MITKASTATEIDEIFASLKKGGSGSASGKTSTPVPAQSKLPIATSDVSKPASSSKKKKKKTTQAKDSCVREDEVPSMSSESRSSPVESNAIENGPDSTAPASKKRRIPETVVDPSIALSSLSKKRREEANDGKTSPSSKVNPIDEDLAKFIDSRGAGQRTRTEEGYLVYKEDELGIREDGGDTPLCPFDCDCCECQEFCSKPWESICPQMIQLGF